MHPGFSHWHHRFFRQTPACRLHIPSSRRPVRFWHRPVPLRHRRSRFRHRQAPAGRRSTLPSRPSGRLRHRCIPSNRRPAPHGHRQAPACLLPVLPGPAAAGRHPTGSQLRPAAVLLRRFCNLSSPWKAPVRRRSVRFGRRQAPAFRRPVGPAADPDTAFRRRFLSWQPDNRTQRPCRSDNSDPTEPPDGSAALCRRPAVPVRPPTVPALLPAVPDRHPDPPVRPPTCRVLFSAPVWHPESPHKHRPALFVRRRSGFRNRRSPAGRRHIPARRPAAR